MSNGARLSAVIVVVAVAAIGLYFAFMTPSTPSTENPKAPVDALVSPDPAQGIGELTGAAAASAGDANGAPPPEAFGAGSGSISVPATDSGAPKTGAPATGAAVAAGASAGSAAAAGRTATPVTPTGSVSAGGSATGVQGGGAAIPAPPVAVKVDPAPASSGSTQYTIKSGDTLEGIARTQMGSGQKWQQIVAANPGLDPKALKIGQKITIPAAGTTTSQEKAAAPAGSSATAAPNTYTVQKGDTLIELSRKFYGSETEWKRILEANATTLKGDAKAITPGMKLVIPAKR